MGVTRFEDLIAWQKARALTKRVYAVSRQGEFARDFGLARQLQRAAVSIMSNIAEGFERKRTREFHQFLSTSKSSCAEVRSLLYVARDVGYLGTTEFDRLLQDAEEVGRIIGGLRASVASPRADEGAPVKGAEPESLRTQNSELSTPPRSPSLA